MEDTPAAKAGIQPGDRIVRINGVQNPTWEQVLPKEVLSPNQPMSVEVQRGSQTFNKTIVPLPLPPEQWGSAGWVPDQPNIVTDLEPGMPAEKAGIKVGDNIVAVNNTTVRSMPEVIRFLQDNKDKPVEFTLIRNGQPMKITVTPQMADVEGLSEQRWRVGFRSEPVETVKLPFAAALRKSLEDNKKNSYLILELAQKMLRHKISMKQIDGPIGIGRAAGQAARQGVGSMAALTAAISLNLGIFNLFPIPILDGGVILMLFIEGLMGHDISLRIKERVYQVAFVFLLLFAVMVIYNDLVKTLPGLAQRLP
jgi:regulator of sigma E protease